MTIQSGYAAEGDITLATAGAQLNLDNLAAAPIVSGSGGDSQLERGVRLSSRRWQHNKHFGRGRRR